MQRSCWGDSSTNWFFSLLVCRIREQREMLTMKGCKKREKEKERDLTAVLLFIYTVFDRIAKLVHMDKLDADKQKVGVCVQSKYIIRSLIYTKETIDGSSWVNRNSLSVSWSLFLFFSSWAIHRCLIDAQPFLASSSFLLCFCCIAAHTHCTTCHEREREREKRLPSLSLSSS